MITKQVVFHDSIPLNELSSQKKVGGESASNQIFLILHEHFDVFYVIQRPSLLKLKKTGLNAAENSVTIGAPLRYFFWR